VNAKVTVTQTFSTEEQRSTVRRRLPSSFTK